MSDFDGGAAAPAGGGSAPEGAVIETNTLPNPQGLGTQTPVAEKPPAADPAAKEQTPKPDASSKTAGDAVRKAFDELKAKDAGGKLPAKNLAKPDAKAVDLKPDAQGRGGDGRFAPREAQGAAQVAQDGQQQRQAPQQDGQQQSPFREAPARFDDTAKAEWEKTPEAVRGSIHRSIRELEQGHQKYKVDAEAFSELREYDALAKQHGTSIKGALTHYHGMEQLLKQDPIGGLERIVANLRLPSADGRHLTLHDIAAHVLGQKPEERSARQSSELQTLRGQVASLQQQLGGVTQAMQEQRETEIFSKIEGFKSANPRFDELAEAIAEEIRHGYDLPTAYQRAERLNPATSREPVIPANGALAQTQVPQARQVNPAGQKSISGAPSSGSDPATARKGPVPSTRQALDAALKRLASG